MRKFMLSVAACLLLLTTAFAQVTSFTYTPQYPAPGQKVTIKYNPAGTVLFGEATIKAIAYLMTGTDDPKAMDVPLTKSNGEFTGTITLENTTGAVALLFSAGDKKDNNSKNGYFFQVYTSKKQPVAGSNQAIGELYRNTYANYLLELEQSPELALTYNEKEFEDYPANRKKTGVTYFAALWAVKKSDATDEMKKDLEDLEVAGNLEETDYTILSGWYERLKMKDKAEALQKEMKEKFPAGKWLQNEKFLAIRQEKDTDKRGELIQAYLKNFPPRDANDNNIVDYLHSLIISDYVAKKDWEAVKKELANLSPERKASQLNNMAWGMAEKEENLDFAKEISYEATAWAKKQIDNPTTKKPSVRTESQWVNDRKSTYGMYADTYAYILYKQGDYKNGVAYARDAVDASKGKNIEYNDRYALLLEKTASAAEVKKELEPMIYDGRGGKDMKEVLKRAYVAVNKSDKGLDAYVAAIDQANLERIREEVRKKMLQEDNDAPLFRLVSMEGKEVDLKALKGKVVVLDFWATWCGPCKASFPAMQKTQDKYRNNSDVVFLFIDTWERGANREKLVEEFIAQNNYTFNVLYDTPKKDNPDQFVVVDEYKVNGIPTKFVVDGNGQIRFKSVGYSGNEDAFIQELSTMIDLAGQQGGSGTGGKKGF